MHTYDSDYKLILVGDATMSPYEITAPGGSVEHWNEEAGETLARAPARTYPNAVWLNPVPEHYWPYTTSIDMIARLMGGACTPSRSTASTAPCASSGGNSLSREWSLTLPVAHATGPFPLPQAGEGGERSEPGERLG